MDPKTASANVQYSPPSMDEIRAAILREAAGGPKVEAIADTPFRDPYLERAPATRTRRTAGEAKKRKQQRKQSAKSRKRNTRGTKPKKRRKKR